MTADSVVLALDTAGPVMGVALWDGRRAFERTARLSRGAEEHLPRLVQEVLQDASVSLREVRGIAVATGPGAFTGLRVGVAAAAGFAMALKVPVWPASSLLPRAALVGFGGDLLVMLDARKSRVYAALWRNEVQDGAAVDVEPELALRWVRRPFRAMGEGAVVYRELIEAAGGVVPSNADQPGTGGLGRLGSVALGRGEGIDPLQLRTDYIRAPDAVPTAARERGGD